MATPMTGKGVGVAPYSVRLRITGFLARQHARDGDTHRALVEYHSMLNVDDPAWPDTVEGDSMRIARDIEVAQMMTESGFFDHAVRVLQTTLILARVNKDPQAAVVERQMLATVELAELKGAVVPPVDLTCAEVDVNAPQLRAAEAPQMRSSDAEKPVLTAPPELPSVVSQPASPTPPQTSALVPELPPSDRGPRLSHEMVQAPVEPEPKEESRLSRLLRWRRRFADRDDSQSTMPANDLASRPATAPNVSPTYCPECAGLHHKPVGVASEQSVAVPSSSRQAGLSFESPTVATPTVADTHPSAKAGPELTLTEVGSRSIRQTTQVSPFGTEIDDNGPSLQAPPMPEIAGANETVQEPASEPARMNPTGQVGVAGQVPNPGIFALEGTSTTLAALLRQTGDAANGSIKRTRILRSVNLHSAGESGDPLRDFYCQRIELVSPNGDEFATPVYGQEVVIVDGAGQKPIYVAVMPHFILQIPSNTGHAVTAEEIVDQFRVYWPSIREQEIGVIRYEQWGRASKIARLKDVDISAETPMSGGDVLYVDGLNLDRSQVMSAAEAIARLAGAKVRSANSAVQPTAGSSH